MPPGRGRGAWSQNAVIFHGNEGKMLPRHAKSKTHTDAILAVTSTRIDEALSSPSGIEKKTNINKMYVSKLIKIVHFVGKHNLPIKELYPALLHFLAVDLVGPITKQYLQNCLKNATYNSHATADSLISALSEFIKTEMDTKLRNASDVVIFADEATSVARKEMMGIFLSCYNEDDREFVMKYLALLEVPSTKSAVLRDKLVKILKEQEKYPQKTRFCCFDETNSTSAEISGLQRRIRHISPHNMYVNCRCHRLALCFKHLTDQFFGWQNLTSCY